MGVSRRHLLKKDIDSMKVFIFFGFFLTIIGALTAETWNQATSRVVKKGPGEPHFENSENCERNMMKINVKKTEFKTSANNAVFWQTEIGKKDGTDSKNMLAAHNFAKKKGKMTVEMTKGGKKMDKMKLFQGLKNKKNAAYLWNCASMWFAQQVTGDVDVFGWNANKKSKYAANGIPTF